MFADLSKAILVPVRGRQRGREVEQCLLEDGLPATIAIDDPLVERHAAECRVKGRGLHAGGDGVLFEALEPGVEGACVVASVLGRRRHHRRNRDCSGLSGRSRGRRRGSRRGSWLGGFAGGFFADRAGGLRGGGSSKNCADAEVAVSSAARNGRAKLEKRILMPLVVRSAPLMRMIAAASRPLAIAYQAVKAPNGAETGPARIQALPIKMPAANTMEPPTTTSNAACRNLVSM